MNVFLSGFIVILVCTGYWYMRSIVRDIESDWDEEQRRLKARAQLRKLERAEQGD